MEVDRTARLSNQERLRQLVCDRGQEVNLFCSHDALEFKSLAQKPYPANFVS
ncbi:hypothetical protein ACN4EK_00270 [Pantanalinema rosaneae CENA516]|uniref:hypothetical protein n=1 Tax=Pantanalinema rosaneae TaxID=1620701 RepID=UPI003D6DC523